VVAGADILVVMGKKKEKRKSKKIWRKKEKN
jgi:hypothetical protein